MVFSFTGSGVALSRFPFTEAAVVSSSFPLTVVVQSHVDFMLVTAARTKNAGQRPHLALKGCEGQEWWKRLNVFAVDLFCFTVGLAATPEFTDVLTTICSFAALWSALCCSGHDWDWWGFWSCQHQL